MKLNVGCGTTKIEGYLGVDADAGCKPDICCNIINGIPLENESVERIIFSHTIEHLQKHSHPVILREFHRLLKPDGTLIICYPEFSKILNNWLLNKHGKRKFWEATIYGCQRTTADFHVAAMDTPEFVEVLEECGFKPNYITSEKEEEFNTIIECVKVAPLPTYEDVIVESVWGANFPIVIGEK